MSTTRIVSIAISVIFFILFAVIAYQLATNYELVDEETDTGYSIEARRNPYLAAKLFLTKTGVPTSTLKGVKALDKLPDTDSTLLIAASRKVLSERRKQALLDWIEQGGHLITDVQTLYKEDDEESDDTLLAPFQIRKYNAEEFFFSVGGEEESDSEYDDSDYDDSDYDDSDYYDSEYEDSEYEDSEYNSDNEASSETPIECPDESDDEPSSVKAPPQDGCGLDPSYLTKLNFGTTDDPLYLAFDTTYHLVDGLGDATAIAGSEYGDHLLQYHYGEGLITLVTDLTIWQNKSIDDYDHAYALSLLAGSSNQAYLLYNMDAPYWTKELWQHGKPMVISGLLLLFAWLWFRALRIGPLIHIVNEKPRQLLEHIRTMAHLYWRTGNSIQLIDSARQEVLTHIQKHHGNFRALEKEEQIDYLSQTLSMQSSDIEKALYANPGAKELDLIEISQLLQTIRLTI